MSQCPGLPMGRPRGSVGLRIFSISHFRGGSRAYKSDRQKEASPKLRRNGEEPSILPRESSDARVCLNRVVSNEYEYLRGYMLQDPVLDCKAPVFVMLATCTRSFLQGVAEVFHSESCPTVFARTAHRRYLSGLNIMCVQHSIQHSSA